MAGSNPRLKARRGIFGASGLKGPSVTITAPAGGSTVMVSGSPIVLFTATAFDDLDGDISSAITWTVGLGSPLAVEATGASVDLSSFLEVGSNTVTATSTDSGGKVGTATISVTGA